MPTSSQALLLRNTGRSDLNLDKMQVVGKKSSIGSYPQRELTPCPVSHVDINELWKTSVLDNGEQLIVEDLTNLDNEKDSSIVQSEFNIKGYKTVLSYSKASGSFSWKFKQGDQTENGEGTESETTVLPTAPKTRPKTGVGTRYKRSEVPARPKTAGGADSKQRFVRFAKPLYYCSNKGEKLVCFGLRAPRTKGDNAADSKSILKTNVSCNKGVWSNPSSAGSRNLESGGDGTINVKMKEFKEKTATTRPPGSGAADGGTKAILTKVWKEFNKQRQMASTEKCKQEKIENDSYATSFANRVHPSIYMRKDPPDAGPFDVCFSLRHNEAVSHEELRESIWRQTGVFPVQMKYEPLSIRVGDNGIRSRWIVKTGSREDFNQLIESGLFIDNDNIVVMPMLEVMEREFRTYKFLTTTEEEHAAARIGSASRKNTKKNKI